MPRPKKASGDAARPATKRKLIGFYADPWLATAIQEFCKSSGITVTDCSRESWLQFLARHGIYPPVLSQAQVEELTEALPATTAEIPQEAPVEAEAPAVCLALAEIPRQPIVDEDPDIIDAEFTVHGEGEEEIPEALPVESLPEPANGFDRMKWDALVEYYEGREEQRRLSMDCCGDGGPCQLPLVEKGGE